MDAPAWPFKGIQCEDAFEALKEGVPGTGTQQMKQLVRLIERESKKSSVVADLLEKIASECNEKPIKIFVGKCSCGFVDSYSNWTMDVDDFDHFHEDAPKDESGELIGLTQGEILLHVLEERLLMKGVTGSYEQCHLACFHPTSCQNRYRKQLGFPETIAFFDKDIDEVTGTCNFLVTDRKGNRATYHEVQAGKSSYVEQWKNYKPSIECLKFTKLDYTGWVYENRDFALDFVRKQATSTGIMDKDDKIKFLYWIAEGERVASGKQEPGQEVIHTAQLKSLGPIVVGIAEKKAWDALFTRWRMAADAKAVNGWLEKDKSQKLFREIKEKAVSEEPEPVASRYKEIVTYDPFFVEYTTIKKEKLKEMIVKKTQQFKIEVAEAAIDEYLELVSH